MNMNSVVRVVSALALSLTPLTAATAQTAAQFKPIDEAGQRPDFVAFRARLLKTIERHDVEALLRVVDPQIVISFDDSKGIDAFKRQWTLDRSRSGRYAFDPDGLTLWQELAAALRLGGRWQEGSFVAPYVSTDFPGDALDAAVTAANVRVHASPAGGSAVLTRLTYGIIRLGGNNAYVQRPWALVELADGRSGYVDARYLRAPLDYRACFAQNGSDDEWRLTAFIAGD